MTTLDHAREYAAAGLSVIPIRTDGSKAPACGSWREFQQRIPTADELSRLFRNGSGIAAIAGKVSGDLEILDFEAAAAFEKWLTIVEAHDPDLCGRLVIIQTPSGGHHVFYRCHDGIEANQKLALRLHDGRPEVLIETRGEGGYVLTVGSPARCHVDGRLYTLLQGALVPGTGEHTIPTLTADQRGLLLDAARSFNEVIQQQQKERTSAGTGDAAGRPGDDFNTKSTWEGLLGPAGWTSAGGHGEVTYWRRPGKKYGFSATTNYGGSGLLYVFSSNASPFESDHSYSRFAAYALLSHGGDFTAAARQLGREGYGEQRQQGQGGQHAATDEDPEPVPVKYSDDAIADLFSARHAHDFRYVDSWGWLQWTGTRWFRIPDVAVMDYARQICRNQSELCEEDPELPDKVRAGLSRALASAKTVASVVRLAASDQRHYRSVSQFDDNLWLFNTPSGTIDLKTGRLHPHNPEDCITRIASVSPEGECPKWLAFLDRVTGGDAELKSYLQRLAGYAMCGDPLEEVLAFFYGPGGNGKGVFLSTLQFLFGEYATTAATETFLETRTERHPTDVAKLAGIRLVVAQEIDEGQHWNETRLKTMTGRDELTARFMRRDFFTFIPEFTLIISGNNKPAIKSVDEAWRRRFHLVPFDVTIPKAEQNPDLKNELREETRRILAWAVEGCLEWQRHRLNPPDAVLAATAEYLEDEDTLRLWLADCCLTGHPGYEEPSAWLYASHRRWTEARGERPLGTKRFSQRCKKAGYRDSQRTSGDRARIFAGIRLTDAERETARGIIEAQKRRDRGDRTEDYFG